MGDKTLRWGDFLPIGMGKSGQLSVSIETKKAEVASKSTEEVGASSVFLRSVRAQGAGRTLSRGHKWACAVRCCNKSEVA